MVVRKTAPTPENKLVSGVGGRRFAPPVRSAFGAETALYAATASAAATAARGTFSLCGKRNLRLDHEAHVGQVDIHAADGSEQIFADAEGKTVFFLDVVVVRRLVQSQCQTRAASAAGSQINANARFGLVRKERFQFLARVFGEIDHDASE